jgi:hypothetical protein
MFVHFGDRSFKVQFVHASAEPGTLTGRPNSLRFVVEHLAASLARRVTLCEIAEVTYDPVVKDDFGRPAQVFTPISQGWAVCHHKDQFNKRTGRTISLHRALAAAWFSYEECNEFASQVLGLSVEELVAKCER